MSEQRDSFMDSVRSVPRVTKVVVGVIAALVSLLTSVGAVAVRLDSVTTDAELADALERHDHAPRTVNPEQSPHPPYATAIAADEARDFAAEQDRRETRKLLSGLYEHVVSVHAATFEPDSRRRAAAAAFARSVYREATKGGASPDDAADQALDTRPPWRR